MSELISYQFEDGIATLTLNNGKVNAISPAVIEASTRPWTRRRRTAPSSSSPASPASSPAAMTSR